MYEIKAYVREVMAEHVVDALAKVKGVASIAVVSLNEFGHLVGDESPLEKVQMVKLEVDVATDTVADEVVDIIVRTSRTRDGHPGDGKVLVSRLVQAVRIEDGATDESALQPTSS
ncbi:MULTISPECIES: P-II family nitrogen regulator [unclassified Marinobacter]|uniref:P-II family nitrogen regulator n=1 Tax=unclassified Marinobacter TaxID=83889 RepID=UPI0019267A9B|nr:MULTISPECIES: P-II family nitrogen regulator [unclassified Marinobacter]MBL3827036.1 P-II family nitrogen regulator [Marinobacter sp. MC3]MBL3895542.1 P-II family nitrogen regulator [Marinobacter sp. MW3]